MNLVILEILVIALALVALLTDLWLPAKHRRALGYALAAGLAGVLAVSFLINTAATQSAFGGMYLLDPMALYFKRIFLVAGVLVILLAIEDSDRLPAGHTEYHALTLFALAGMMFAASSNDLIMMFVSLELITVAFYILVSFQRAEERSLEAGVKYLILGALSTGFLVFGIALIFGSAGTTEFNTLYQQSETLARQPIFLFGLLMIVAGLGFKIAAFPFQIWAPDVYQGAPVPTAAFLAIGSKAAGFVLLIRVTYSAAPDAALALEKLWMTLAALTILYGNLCALPQRNLKRLLGYSSIANAGYLLLGVAVMTAAGSSAMLYYLGAYLFTIIAAFTVIALAMKNLDDEDITGLAGLHKRSPLLAAAMTLAMISLAGIPPLAGFFGKFLLLKAVVQQAAQYAGYYWLLGAALFGVILSIYYYFGVIRTIYWTDNPDRDAPTIPVPLPIKTSLAVCVAGMLTLGLYPNTVMEIATKAVRALNFTG